MNYVWKQKNAQMTAHLSYGKQQRQRNGNIKRATAKAEKNCTLVSRKEREQQQKRQQKSRPEWSILGVFAHSYIHGL